ncbi:hypothetical protein H6F67_21915 [Microcoleus sp. FACHB-1515]|uniref:hypothetical protein n=1 Tax=Cyanophyceae TaxID=3028117 RepID=UPI001688284B|nr:hypothetical protein [Microcoleus sp. FACHB-1515]MBD2092509.1 hypothetical protein [Microcoleus sp. FACHB-1515]
MTLDPEKSIQIKVTVPRPIADRMKKIAKQRGMPVSQLMLQATINAYPSLIEDDDQE